MTTALKMTAIKFNGEQFLLNEAMKNELLTLIRRFEEPMIRGEITSAQIVECFLHKYDLIGPGASEATVEDKVSEDDWNLIVGALYHLDEKRTIRLTAANEKIVRAMGDGYGKMSWQELHDRELCWDWSHIRDSTPAAKRAMAQMIREFLGQ
jgi:hypothetical protein